MDEIIWERASRGIIDEKLVLSERIILMAYLFLLRTQEHVCQQGVSKELQDIGLDLGMLLQWAKKG